MSTKVNKLNALRNILVTTTALSAFLCADAYGAAVLLKKDPKNLRVANKLYETEKEGIKQIRALRASIAPLEDGSDDDSDFDPDEVSVQSK